MRTTRNWENAKSSVPERAPETIQEGTVMRVWFGLFYVAVMVAGFARAQAALAPDHIVGRWAADAECAGSAFAYVSTGEQILHELQDNGRVYRTPVEVDVEGDVVRVRFDEKVYSFRLPAPDRLQAVGYTDTRNGLTVSIGPRVWHRCPATG